jgi:hypothetical protein
MPETYVIPPENQREGPGMPGMPGMAAPPAGGSAPPPSH